MWKGIKGVGVLLPLVFIYFGKWKIMYLLAPKYVYAMRPGEF